MIRINQIKIPVSFLNKTSFSQIKENDNKDDNLKEELIKKAASLLYISKDEIRSCSIVKKSIDARKKPDIYFIYTIDVEIENEDELLKRLSKRRSHRGGSNQITKAEVNKYHFPSSDVFIVSDKFSHRPVIIGTGPAGLFCGYFLARYGYRPILLERGKAVEDRQKDVEEFWKNGILNPDSNVQFGEGGAGTFSDGKLNTLIKDKNGKNKEVLRIFVDAGAPEEILYEAKPHIGTDILMKVIRNIRNEIIANGGEIRFESKVTDIVIDKGAVKEVIINDSEHLSADVVVLAIGHSARDTFRMLHNNGIPMESKAFAVGLRVEHPRKMINQLQYGIKESKLLPTADYKLTARSKDGRGVYSFCMCPGGYVVNASSQNGRLAVNGMSYSGRNGNNSNSAIIVTVTPEDFGGIHPLAGVEFQQRLEEKAYEIGEGKVPVETYGDFKEAVTGALKSLSIIKQEYPDFMPEIKGAYGFAPVHQILTGPLNNAFIEGMEQFGNIMPGFADSGVYVSGVESRTSSPVRIHRDETGQSEIKGLYPCGEGAGYAGGITSAAMDGITVAEKIMEDK
ncbi:MAG: FAD-dependent oxidoreductase [Lachnospiraceae bacterium]|nr:FAD-dependent oxidoreductase [Lachnospiraceae bacterium]